MDTFPARVSWITPREAQRAPVGVQDKSRRWGQLGPRLLPATLGQKGFQRRGARTCLDGAPQGPHQRAGALLQREPQGQEVPQAAAGGLLLPGLHSEWSP
eukprot:3823654-Pyramimonas_sp.AAC.1